jgi:hypothetical protein
MKLTHDEADALYGLLTDIVCAAVEADAKKTPLDVGEILWLACRAQSILKPDEFAPFGRYMLTRNLTPEHWEAFVQGCVEARAAGREEEYAVAFVRERG